MILLTELDADGLWHCTDSEQEDSPLAPHGRGASDREAVSDFLAQISNDQLDTVWWNALSGLNLGWLPLINEENKARHRRARLAPEPKSCG